MLGQVVLWQVLPAAMFMPQRPAPPASSGNAAVDAAAKAHGWQAVDRAGEILYRKQGSRDVVVTKRVLEQQAFRDRIVRQLERL